MKSRWVLLTLLVVVLFASAVFAQESKSLEGAGGISLLQLLKDGSWIGWIIIALSILGLGLVIDSFMSTRRSALIPPNTLSQVESMLGEKRVKEALEAVEGDPSFVGRVLAAGLSKAAAGYSVMQASMADAGEEESIKFHQKIGYLNLIAAVSPMLGLLGTVVGMIVAFQRIVVLGDQVTAKDMAEGISVALVTTCLGLLVAIPMTCFFLYFRNKVVRAGLEIGIICEELTARFRPTGARRAGTAQAAAPAAPTTQEGTSE